MIIKRAASQTGGNITIIKDRTISSIPKASNHPQLFIPRFFKSKECPIRLTPLNKSQKPIKKPKMLICVIIFDDKSIIPIKRSKSPPAKYHPQPLECVLLSENITSRIPSIKNETEKKVVKKIREGAG